MIPSDFPSAARPARPGQTESPAATDVDHFHAAPRAGLAAERRCRYTLCTHLEFIGLIGAG